MHPWENAERIQTNLIEAGLHILGLQVDEGSGEYLVPEESLTAAVCRVADALEQITALMREAQGK